MATDGMNAGAEHVLAHGTARTRAAAAKSEPKDKAAGKKKADGKKRIKRMTIEPADDGSHVIRHEHHQPDGDLGLAGKRVEDETYTAPDTEALKQHIEEHLGAGGMAEDEQAESAGEGAEEEARGGEGGAEGASAG